MKAVLFLALLLPATALANDRRVDFVYDARFVGLFDMRLEGEVRFADGRYAVGMRLATTGMGDTIARFRMQAESAGVVASPAMPRTHAQKSESRFSGLRSVSIVFDDSGLPATEVTPPPTKDEREIVTPEQARGAVDLLTAIARVVTQGSPEEACSGTIPVFDGRRRYDLLPEQGAMVRLEPSAEGEFAGPALKCTMRQKRIAGFKATDGGKRKEEALAFEVYLARPADWPVVMPVRIEVESNYGRAISHLAGATVDGKPLDLQRP